MIVIHKRFTVQISSLTTVPVTWATGPSCDLSLQTCSCSAFLLPILSVRNSFLPVIHVSFPHLFQVFAQMPFYSTYIALLHVLKCMIYQYIFHFFYFHGVFWLSIPQYQLLVGRQLNCFVRGCISSPQNVAWHIVELSRY